MRDEPLVSVVMPIYNAEKFLGEAIESILNQSYKNIELIVVNDGSTDKSGKIVERFRKKDKRIKVLINKKALGYGGEAATNIAIKKAKGKYIAKMDADDVSMLERIEKEVEFLENNKNIFLVGSQALIIDSSGKIVGKRNVPLKHDEIWKEFYLRSCVVHPSIMFRNEGIIGDFFKLKFKHFNDYYTFFELMKNGKRFENLSEYLFKYRVHGDNTVYTNIKEKFRENYRIKKYFLSLGYQPYIKQRLMVFFQLLVVNLVPEKILFWSFNKLSKFK
jgi:glycosyltransferase involved in cell wall biosynthesis